MIKTLRIFEPYEEKLRHAILTRHLPLTDTAKIQKILNTNSPVNQFNKQLHGIKAYIITEPKKSPLNGETMSDGDILITNQPHTPLLIRVADCASVMLFDPKHNVIANIHAGWRGLTKRVIREGIQILRKRFHSNSKDIRAGISPMLGICCSKFSNPHKELPKFLHRFISEENHVDLWSIVENQLIECGIPPKQIENPRICTSCNTDQFYSYRREGPTTGRFGTIIMLK